MSKKTLSSLSDLKILSNGNESSAASQTPPRPTSSKKVEHNGFVPQGVTIKMRLEKNQRGGKIVTVLYALPYERSYFESLTKELKNKVGSGGTLKEEITDKKAELSIEIQGDHQSRLYNILREKGFLIKGFKNCPT